MSDQSAVKQDRDPLTGPIVPIFFYYTIPWVVGLLMMSSAIIVDAIFLGNYVGAGALAAVNMILPATSLLFAVTLMISVGGSVMCGKYIGEGRKQAADAIFTKTFLAVIIYGLVFSVVGIVFLDDIVALLGVNDELAKDAGTYFTIFCLYQVFLMGAISLSYFVRLDGRPVFVSTVIIANAFLNIALDYIFIVEWQMGVAGAASATAVSHASSFLFFSSHLWLGKGRLRLTRQFGALGELLRAAYNGASEGTNEMSAGLLTLLFNWIMIRRVGVDGVAAFSIINYLLFFGLMIAYAVADSLQPLVSTNFGARQPRRIAGFVLVACLSVAGVGVILAALLLLAPERMVGVFLKDGEVHALAIALEFSTFFWPAFLFCGLNIVISAYLTSMQRPLASASVALTRSLVLPAVLLLLLPMALGDRGIYLSIPIAEAITLALAGALLLRNRPGKLDRLE
jgi:MATE family, multidrug efflux pump